MATRRIRMKTESAGPKGNRVAGKEYSVEQAEGEELVAGGFAEWVKPVAPAKVAKLAEPTAGTEEAAEVKEVEVATKPEPENAATRTRPARKRPARKRGKKG